MISAVTISLFLFERAVEPIQLLKTFATLQISYFIMIITLCMIPCNVTRTQRISYICNNYEVSNSNQVKWVHLFLLHVWLVFVAATAQMYRVSFVLPRLKS